MISTFIALLSLPIHELSTNKNTMIIRELCVQMMKHWEKVVLEFQCSAT